MNNSGTDPVLIELAPRERAAEIAFRSPAPTQRMRELRAVAVEKFANGEQMLASREPPAYMRISVWVMEMH